MKKGSKISFYDIEDVEKLGAIDDISCNAKTFLNIFIEVLPFFCIMAISKLLPILEIFSNILASLVNIIFFLYLFSIHHYNRILYFELIINDNQMKYKNEQGKVFNYKVNEIINVKMHHYRRMSSIEINMKDGQTIWIKDRDKQFYKLTMYLEQNKLFKK